MTAQLTLLMACNEGQQSINNETLNSFFLLPVTHFIDVILYR